MKYEDIRHNLNTGDIVLFSGRGLVSRGIQIASGSKWSHVGMALRLAEFDSVMLLESTTLSNMKDHMSGVMRSGVQMVELSARVATYEGDIGIRHLITTRTHEMMTALAAFRHEIKGRPYERNTWELFGAALADIGDEDLSSLFCSELVAEAYQRIGLLPDDKPSNDYSPAELATLELAGDAELGDIIAVEPPL